MFTLAPFRSHTRECLESFFTSLLAGIGSTEIPTLSLSENDRASSTDIERLSIHIGQHGVSLKRPFKINCGKQHLIHHHSSPYLLASPINRIQVRDELLTLFHSLYNVSSGNDVIRITEYRPTEKSLGTKTNHHSVGPDILRTHTGALLEYLLDFPDSTLEFQMDESGLVRFIVHTRVDVGLSARHHASYRFL